MKGLGDIEMTKYPFATLVAALVLLTSATDSNAIPVLPGQTFRSDFDLSDNIINHPCPCIFEQYSIDLYWSPSSPWLVGEQAYIEIRNQFDDILAGLFFTQFIPSAELAGGFSGFGIPIQPLVGVESLVGYVLLTSIDADFELLSSSGYFTGAGGSGPSTGGNLRQRVPFVAAPYNPPPQTSDVPEPTTLALLGLGLVGIGFARRRRAS